MKKYKLLLVLLISVIVPFFALSSVKAMTQSRIQTNQQLFDDNNNVVGWFNNYGYFTSSSSEVINTSMFGVGPVGYYKTVNVITIGFNTSYTGEIRIDFRGSLSNYQLVYPDGENVGAYRWSGGNQVLFVSFVNCTSFDVYMYSTTQYSVSNIPSYVSATSFESLTESTSSSGSGNVTIAGYNIPITSWSAYNFVCLTPEVKFTDGDIYPYITVGGNNNGSRYSETVFLPRYGWTPIDFVFYAPDHAVTTNSFTLYNDDQYFYTLFNPIGSNIYGHLYKITFMSSADYGTASAQGGIEWLETFDIIPIYFGVENQCPEELRGLCGYTLWNYGIYTELGSIHNLLGDVYNLLLNDDPPDNYDEDIMDDAGDAISGINLIEADFMDDFSDAFSDINLNNYTISSSLNNTVIWLTHNMTEIFSHSGDFQILYTLPLILGIALFFIGRGSVVFRQGNIDRSREHGEATWQRHREQIKSERTFKANPDGSEGVGQTMSDDELRRRLGL